MGLTVSGTEPTEGYVQIKDNQVTNYSMRFGEYVVTYDYDTDTISSIKNGDIVGSPRIIPSEIGTAVKDFGGYDWHVIGSTNDTVTLLMDAGETGNYKLPDDSKGNLIKDETNKVSKMPHCPTGTSYCNKSSSYTYSWDKSAISDYLNGTFLPSFESQIESEIIPVTVCNDPSRDDGEKTYGGYLKSEIETIADATCNIGKSNNYSSYKVRLITKEEYNKLKGLSDKSWIYSSYIGSWWTMVSFYNSTATFTRCAHNIYGGGNWNATAGNDALGVRPVITIAK